MTFHRLSCAARIPRGVPKPFLVCSVRSVLLSLHRVFKDGGLI